MKALLLCAGAGTRLGSLCVDRPKPLLDVGGQAIAAHILMRLARHGFREIYLNLHHHADAFPAHLGDGAQFGVKLHYLHEATPLGTGGTSRNVLMQLREDLLVHYGDILTEHDLGALLRAHQGHDAFATALVHQRVGSNSRATLDADDRITTFAERPPQTPSPDAAAASPSWAFSGICVLSPRCLDWLPGPTDRALDLPRDLFQPLALTGRLFAQRLSGYRCAVDSQERLAAARRAYVDGQFMNEEVL
ncbi:MAG TPA: nucleotidyltransferase family protein [Polyangia bacterium]